MGTVNRIRVKAVVDALFLPSTSTLIPANDTPNFPLPFSVSFVSPTSKSTL